MASEEFDTEEQQCESRRFVDAVRCDEDATEYIVFEDRSEPRDPHVTRVYCSEHADHFAEKAHNSVLDRGVLE